MQRILATTLARSSVTCLRDCCQGESRIVSPHYRKWNGPMVLFWLHLASTIPPNAAPEAGLRARVSPATVNTRFNSGVLTCTFWSLPLGLFLWVPRSEMKRFLL